MMGASKLGLLMLLSTSALAFSQENDQPTCPLAKTYKTLHKYEYQYEAESLNAINGASALKNGPKAFCTVEIEVPQTCSFIVHTTGCSLTEVVDMDAEGNPVFGPAPSSADFAAEMEKYPLKVVVDSVYDVKLYPEDSETTTILNIKRGIISVLGVPLLKEDNENMPTIHGKCKTHYKVNARGDAATDIRLKRDLSTCDKFVPMRDYTSPLALISGMHYPLAQLVKSHQTCNYRFDNKKKHMTSGSCTEKHILIPFSHKGEYGVTNVGKQQLTLVQVSSHNERVFQHSDIVRGLHMEAVEDKSAFQDKNAALNLLRELATLPETEGERRAHLFQKLVTMVRGMKAGTLSPVIPEALAVSHVLTYQVLAQCGTPECSSAIMQILRTFDSSSLKVDATVFAMGLISNPSALLIHDMLQMAKDKPNKPIMYALSNVVKRFYKAEGKLIPEIHSVAEFMASRLGDCSGDNDNTFMTLRDREVLMQVLLEGTSHMQKRIAAYLVLMKDPQQSELIQLIDALPNEWDIQIKSFIISHINNILTSTEPETQELRQRIRVVLQGNEIGPFTYSTMFSRNYKIGPLEGNVIFEGSSYLPKEVMLEMTLKAFGFDIDMMEIGLESNGFDPTVDALFGENGFFPDTALKTMYFVSDNAPLKVNEILEDMLPALKNYRMKKQTSQNLMREIGNNLNKLVRDLKSSQSPEAMAYLRLLGNELGYLTTKEMEEMTYSVTRMIDYMFRMFSTDLIVAMMANGDHTIFAHYIFMDNEFFLPTLTGVPLRIALSGTFTPGVKGGIKLAREMSEVSFIPSAGIEFVTRVGSHIPEYVNSGLEMHTNIFHESGLNAKISMAHDHVKLTIPAPISPTKLIKMTNNLVAVTGSEVKTITPTMMDKVEVSKCTPVFTGMKYCTSVKYFDTLSRETTPYFPLTGDSKFEVELYPTGEVTEYTATVAYELLKEGEERRQKVDALKFILRAEGTEPTEARAILKYNRKKNAFTADIQIPDYDVEAGLRLGITNGNTKGKGTHSIYLDFTNKNLPQLSLVGRANLKAMKEGMLQVQLLVPSVNADATLTAKMKYDEEVELELESKIQLMDAISKQRIEMKYGGEVELEFESKIQLVDAISKQRIEMKYDESKIKVEFESDVKTEEFRQYGIDLLNTQVLYTDMKVGHIFKKIVEATNNYMEEYGDEIPYIQNFRLPDMPEISLPETLYLNIQAKAVYHFSHEHFIIAIPLPLGGKSSEDLNFPQTLITPSISLPKFGLEIVSMEIPLPEFVVPESLSLVLPLFGKADVLTLLRSNLYTMEASVALGKDVLEAQAQASSTSYSFKFDVNGISPLEILSIRMKGLGMLTISDSIEANLESSFSHKIIGASVKIVEDVTITDKISLKSSINIEATSPFGLNFELEQTGVSGINTEEISAENSFVGTVTAGTMYAKTISTQSFTIFPDRSEAMMGSKIQFDSTIFQGHNTFAANLGNGEFTVVSATNFFQDVIKHVIELSFKEYILALKCDSSAHVLDMKIHNQAEASAGTRGIVMRIETNADHSENRVDSVLTASLDVNGLAVDTNANVKLFENEATKKASLKMNENGLIISGITILQSPFPLENTFNVEVDSSKATLSITNNGGIHDVTANNTNTLTITLCSLNFKSKAEATASEFASYSHDIIVDYTPYSSSASVNNNLKILDASFINEAELNAELDKMDLTGTLKAMYGPEEIKHVYQVNYADKIAIAKCTTIGKILGTHINHNSELVIVGLTAKTSSDVHFTSQAMHYGHSLHCTIVPYDISLDAIFNAGGDITMYGTHSAQLFGKFLLRANPLAFGSSHECRGSVTQMLDNSFSLETTFENKMVTVLSLQEQTTSYEMKSKMNKHAFNQATSLYNTAEKTGIEISATILTNMLDTDSTENQEFTISGFLKYDKNANTHIIQFPLSENLPFYLEIMIDCVAHTAEALQSYIINKGIMSTLEDFPQYASDFVSQMNIEGNAIQLKQHFLDFTEKSISVEDLEAYLRNLIHTSEEILTSVMLFIFLEGYEIHDYIKRNYELPKILIEEITQHLEAFIKKYNIMDMLVYIMEELASPYFEVLIRMIPDEFFLSPNNYILGLVKDSGILDSISRFFANIRELITKFGTDKKIQAVLEKAVELIKQSRIEETGLAIIKIVKEANLPTKFMQVFQSAIDYLKSTEVNNMLIETIVQKLNTLNYKDFVDYANLSIAEWTVYLNGLIRTLEIPQKVEATRNFVEFVMRSFIEDLREIKIAEIIQSVLHIIGRDIVYNCERFTTFIKHTIPTQLDIPEFTIVGYTVTPTTILFDDISGRIIKILEFILNCDIDMSHMDAFLNDLTLNYHPFIPEITLPEITVPEISFPTIPRFPKELVPENGLPGIPSDVVVPCFGNLYGQIKFLTPVYAVKMEAGFQNSTENEMTPHFTGFFNSQATSSFFEILNYNLQSSTVIGIPKMSRVVLVETIQFNHLALGFEHRASLTLYGQSGQAQAKTAVMVTTAPYTANILNKAFIAIEEGMSASLDTNYAHLLNLPTLNVISEVNVTQKLLAQQDGLTFTLSADNSGTGKDNIADVNHKSNLQVTFTPNIVTLTFSGDTDSTILKMKQQINAEISNLSKAKLYDMKVELKANCETELCGVTKGNLSNGINIVVHPAEFVFKLKNKGNVDIGNTRYLNHIELQKDYLAVFTPDSQKITTVSLTHLDDYKVFYNVSVLLENAELNGKVVHQKKQTAPHVHIIGLIQIPNVDSNSFYDVLQQVLEEVPSYMKISEERVEIDLEFPLPL
ncbi:Apolipoprotein B-100 [Channa argus]|uniref:Apolipoprotein B-100 n=1 Tax=Channa argus TaxID=215402 RepID=A0A6G1QKF9_CHAAH|nr:Apolipoprotein B-100 [Channa argus]